LSPCRFHSQNRHAGKRQPYIQHRYRSDSGCTGNAPSFPLIPQTFPTMQEQVTLECTEAKKEGKPASRYLTFRNKKTVTERIEKKKYNWFLKRHTVHKEIK
jgi:large subunit ribosomal protein L33